MSNVQAASFGKKITPQQTLIEALNNIEGVKVAVCVIIDKDDMVQTNWSSASMLMRMGMMDVAKTVMFEIGQEDE